MTFETTDDGTHRLWVGTDSWSAAESEPRAGITLATPGGGNGDGIGTNPATPGSFRLEDDDAQTGRKTVTLWFSNLGSEPRDVTEAGSTPAPTATVRLQRELHDGGGPHALGPDGTVLGRLPIGKDFRAVNPQPTVDTGTLTVLEFDRGVNPNDRLVITPTVGDGTSRVLRRRRATTRFPRFRRPLN